MKKQRAENGIDYTPRRPEAIAAANRRPMERHIHGIVQRKQQFPIFEVTSAGKTIEWSDSRASAHSAFADADALPKHLIAVFEDGRRELLDTVSATGRRPQAEPIKLAA